MTTTVATPATFGWSGSVGAAPPAPLPGIPVHVRHCGLPNTDAVLGRGQAYLDSVVRPAVLRYAEVLEGVAPDAMTADQLRQLHLARGAMVLEQIYQMLVDATKCGSGVLPLADIHRRTIDGIMWLIEADEGAVWSGFEPEALDRLLRDYTDAALKLHVEMKCFRMVFDDDGAYRVQLVMTREMVPPAVAGADKRQPSRATG